MTDNVYMSEAHDESSRDFRSRSHSEDCAESPTEVTCEIPVIDATHDRFKPENVEVTGN